MPRNGEKITSRTGGESRAANEIERLEDQPRTRVLRGAAVDVDRPRGGGPGLGVVVGTAPH